MVPSDRTFLNDAVTGRTWHGKQLGPRRGNGEGRAQRSTGRGVRENKGDYESQPGTEAGGSRGSREGSRRRASDRHGREPGPPGRGNDAAPREGTRFGRVFQGGQEHARP